MNENEQHFERERDDANREYFLTLARGRFSLQALSGMAVITALLLGLSAIPLSSMLFSHSERVEPWFVAHLALIGASLLVGVAAAANPWVFRFQVFSTGIMACCAAVGWVYAICLLIGSVASTVADPAGGAMVSRSRLALLGVGGAVIVLGAVVVHVLLLRRRLRVGHSRERTMGNLGVPMRASRLKVGLIVVGALFIAANVATRGQYFLLISGSIGLVFMACVTPSLVVEFVYLAYLKARDRAYWEEAPPRRVVTGRDVTAVLRRVGKWVLVLLGVVVALVLLSKPSG